MVEGKRSSGGQMSVPAEATTMERVYGDGAVTGGSDGVPDRWGWTTVRVTCKWLRDGELVTGGEGGGARLRRARPIA